MKFTLAIAAVAAAALCTTVSAQKTCPAVAPTAATVTATTPKICTELGIQCPVVYACCMKGKHCAASMNQMASGSKCGEMELQSAKAGSDSYNVLQCMKSKTDAKACAADTVSYVDPQLKSMCPGSTFVAVPAGAGPMYTQLDAQFGSKCPNTWACCKKDAACHGAIIKMSSGDKSSEATLKSAAAGSPSANLVACVDAKGTTSPDPTACTPGASPPPASSNAAATVPAVLVVVAATTAALY